MDGSHATEATDGGGAVETKPNPVPVVNGHSDPVVPDTTASTHTATTHTDVTANGVQSTLVAPNALDATRFQELLKELAFGGNDPVFHSKSSWDELVQQTTFTNDARYKPYANPKYVPVAQDHFEKFCWNLTDELVEPKRKLKQYLKGRGYAIHPTDTVPKLMKLLFGDKYAADKRDICPDTHLRVLLAEMIAKQKFLQNKRMAKDINNCTSQTAVTVQEDEVKVKEEEDVVSQNDQLHKRSEDIHGHIRHESRRERDREDDRRRDSDRYRNGRRRDNHRNGSSEDDRGYRHRDDRRKEYSKRARSRSADRHRTRSRSSDRRNRNDPTDRHRDRRADIERFRKMKREQGTVRNDDHFMNDERKAREQSKTDSNSKMSGSEKRLSTLNADRRNDETKMEKEKEIKKEEKPTTDRKSKTETKSYPTLPPPFPPPREYLEMIHRSWKKREMRAIAAERRRNGRPLRKRRFSRSRSRSRSVERGRPFRRKRARNFSRSRSRSPQGRPRGRHFKQRDRSRDDYDGRPRFFLDRRKGDDRMEEVRRIRREKLRERERERERRRGSFERRDEGKRYRERDRERERDGERIRIRVRSRSPLRRDFDD